MKKNYENSLRGIINEYNIKPKKKLGQNFLHDKNIISFNEFSCFFFIFNSLIINQIYILNGIR